MRLSRYLVTLLSTLIVLLGGAPAIAQASSATSHPAPFCPATDVAGSTTPKPEFRQVYYHDDWRLGPARLPRAGTVGSLLVDFRRTDTMTPDQLLDCYWDPTVDNNKGGWRYPPNMGFSDSITPFTLQVGQIIDRFGANTGRFFSPVGVPYDERALPDSNLDTLDAQHPNGYHTFKVIEQFTVDSGSAAPWFGQPGGGTQYESNDKYFPGEVVPPQHANTQWLIDHNYLEAVG